jgi:hypothetical protein
MKAGPIITALFREMPLTIALAKLVASGVQPGRGGAVEPVRPRRIREEFASMFDCTKLGHTTLTFTPNMRASSRRESENPTTAC